MAAELYIYLGVYILLLLGISYFISRRQGREGFLIADRRRKGWQILFSKFAASIGAAYFITYTGFAYEYGFGVFAMLLGMVLGYLIFAYWAAPKIQEHSRAGKFYTIGHFVYHKTKSKFGMILTDVLSSAILFSWLLTGIIGGSKIISDFGLLSYNFAVLLTVTIVLLYILMAGYTAVIITDIIQSAVIFILLVIITWGIIGSESVGQILSVNTGGIDISIMIAFLLFGVLGVFSYSDRYQLSYAAKTRKGLKHGLGLSIIPFLIVGCFLLLIGLFMASHIPGLDSGLIFTEALKNFLPAFLLPFAIVLFFAGIMSSADTSVYAISSHYAMHRKGDPVSIVRKAMIGLMIITGGLAILFPDVVDVSIFAGGISLTLSFPMVYLFFKGRNVKRFAASAFCGLIGLLIGVAIFGIEPTIALPVLLGSGVGLFYSGKWFGKN